MFNLANSSIIDNIKERYCIEKIFLIKKFMIREKVGALSF